MDTEGESLLPRVRDWLETEGYPVEFRTAHQFRKAKIFPRQGVYVRDSQQGKAREVDVLGQVDRTWNDNLFRLQFVTECKWSRDKPWVVFGHRQGMAASACINQTIGCRIGSAVMWALAGDSEVQDLTMFKRVPVTGYGGRRAFSGGKDHFYDALQSSIANAVSLVAQLDASRRSPNPFRTGMLAFPMIVIDGELLEAVYDEKENDISIQPVGWARIHWRGSDVFSFISTIDVVRVDRLAAFLKQRRSDVTRLCDRIERVLPRIEKCVNEGSLKFLRTKRAPRGTLGLPPLLAEVRERMTLSSPESGGADGVTETPANNR